MFGSEPFSTSALASLGITSVKGTSVLEAIATLVAEQVIEPGGVAGIDAVAILEADGTLTVGGLLEAQLTAVADILASAQNINLEAQVFIWTTPSRSTTWSFSEESRGDRLIWVIPTGVGVTTWVLPK